MVLEFESCQGQGAWNGLATEMSYAQILTKYKTNSAQIQGDLPVIELPDRTKITTLQMKTIKSRVSAMCRQ